MGLSGHTQFHEGETVNIPLGDAVEVVGAVLIVDDNRGKAVAQALLEHQQTADATVAVIKGADALELHVKIQDVLQGDRLLGLVFLTHGGEGGAHLIWGDVQPGFKRGVRGAVGAGGLLLVPMAAQVAKQGAVEFGKETRLQLLHGIVQNEVYTDEMVAGFDEVIELHFFVGRQDLVLVVEKLYLIEGETVAGHAVGGIGQSGLQIIVDATAAGALLAEHAPQERGSGVSASAVGGEGSIVGDEPNAVKKLSFRDAIFPAKLTYQRFGNAPFSRGFRDGNHSHKTQSFQWFEGQHSRGWRSNTCDAKLKLN